MGRSVILVQEKGGGTCVKIVLKKTTPARSLAKVFAKRSGEDASSLRLVHLGSVVDPGAVFDADGDDLEMVVRKLVPIVALVASHVGDAARLESLARTLSSARSQSYAFTLVISWTAASAALFASTKALLEEHSEMVSLEHPGRRLSQFEHLECLSKLKLLSDDVWCLFSDDDDLWHPQRVAWYASRFEDDPGDVVLCARHATGRGGRRPTCPEAVDAALLSRHASISIEDGYSGDFWCVLSRRSKSSRRALRSLPRRPRSGPSA